MWKSAIVRLLASSWTSSEPAAGRAPDYTLRAAAPEHRARQLCRGRKVTVSKLRAESWVTPATSIYGGVRTRDCDGTPVLLSSVVSRYCGSQQLCTAQAIAVPCQPLRKLCKALLC